MNETERLLWDLTVILAYLKLAVKRIDTAQHRIRMLSDIRDPNLPDLISLDVHSFLHRK